MLSRSKYFVYNDQFPKTMFESFIISYKSSLIVFFSTNFVFCIIIFILWSSIFNYNFFSKDKKKIINSFFIIYIFFFIFMITNFFIYKLIWNDYYHTEAIKRGLKLANREYYTSINSYWHINCMNRTMSFFFSTLSFFFFSSFIYKMYINKENWNFNKIYFVPLIMIAQVSLTTFLFAKNFIVIYTSIELFSMVMYYLIIFESTNYKTKFNNNIYNTELSLKYFVISLFGSINILIGIAFIFYSIGSLNFNTIQIYFIPSAEGLEYFTDTGIKFGFITFVIGLLIKMGIGPYHFWINGIYDRFSNSFFEYMSIFPKSILVCFIINLFSIVTLNYPNYGSLSLNNFFTTIGILNIIFGTFSSINQTDMKRIVMYSSLSNIGYIFIAIGANYFSVSVVYSYIIHYTIALFILFRVLNHIEIDQKFTFKQWYFAEFSSLSIKNKIFMTIAIFNISGLPPFAIFFNKFFILNYLWKYEAYYSFITMIIFSVVSYSYYFSIIKYIWFNEKFSGFTAYTNFKKNIKFDNIFNSNKTGVNIIEYLGWDKKDIELNDEGDTFSYEDYAKIVKSSSIYENWIKSFCFEIEKIITKLFIFSTFIGFFSVTYSIVWFDYVVHSGKSWRPWMYDIWAKKSRLFLQTFMAAGGPTSTERRIRRIESKIIDFMYTNYTSQFDNFTKWVASNNVGPKNRTFLVYSDPHKLIGPFKTIDAGVVNSIDTGSKIIYMINKYAIENLSFVSFFLIALYFWLSVNGRFENIPLSLTLIPRVFKRIFQICVAGTVFIMTVFFTEMHHTYFIKNNMKHYYQIKKYKIDGLYFATIVYVYAFILSVVGIMAILIKLVSFFNIFALFIAISFITFIYKDFKIELVHDWSLENIVRTTLDIKKTLKDYIYDYWAKDNIKFFWFQRVRTRRRPIYNKNLIKINKKNDSSN